MQLYLACNTFIKPKLCTGFSLGQKAKPDPILLLVQSTGKGKPLFLAQGKGKGKVILLARSHHPYTRTILNPPALHSLLLQLWDGVQHGRVQLLNARDHVFLMRMRSFLDL